MVASMTVITPPQAALADDLDFVIHNADEFWEFAAAVNDAATNASFTGKTVFLAADIDIHDSKYYIDDATTPWMPIGATVTAPYSTLTFKGIFDGGYHTVKNLTAVVAGNAYVGLFGYIASATVQNLVVQGDYTTTVRYASGVVGGTSGSSTIQNVGNEVDVSTDNITAYAGGVLAYYTGNPTIVSGCYNTGTITTTFVPSSYWATIAGGVVGAATSTGAIVTNCYNLGEVGGNGLVGGIVGGSSSLTSVTLRFTITNCYNAAPIVQGQSNGDAVGAISASHNSGTFTNNYWLKLPGLLGTGGTVEHVTNIAIENRPDFIAESMPLIIMGSSAYAEGNEYPVLAWQVKNLLGAPKITVQPQATWANQGDSSKALSVEATLPSALDSATKDATTLGVLTKVEWFSSDGTSVKVETTSGATVTSSFTPDVSTTSDDSYYAVITNTWVGASAGFQMVKSNPARFKVTDPAIVAAPPVFASQPQDAVLDQASTGNTIELALAPLPTDAAQSAAYSYQWYVNFENKNEGGKIIGTNSPTLAPSTVDIGDYFYYCVVTRTVEDVKAASAATNTAHIHIKGFEIYTAMDLYNLRLTVNNPDADLRQSFANRNIELMNDIDLSKTAATREWVPIGVSGATFQGTFDGHGHTISGLSITDCSLPTQGFFGATSNSTVKNLVVKGNITATAAAVTTVRGIGGGTLINVGFEGDITAVGTWGARSTSGLGGTSIIGSYYKGNISAPGAVGGLTTSIGASFGNYAQGTITHTIALNGNNVGGITSSHDTSKGTVTNNYSTIAIKGEGGTPIADSTANFGGVNGIVTAYMGTWLRNYYLDSVFDTDDVTFNYNTPPALFTDVGEEKTNVYMQSAAFVEDLNEGLTKDGQPFDYFLYNEGGYPKLYWEGTTDDTNTSVLSAAIASATDAKDVAVVSADGSDVPETVFWVGAQDVEALTQAIGKAQGVLSNPYSTQSQLDAAAAALATALSTFETAKTPGTIPTNPPNESWVRLSGQGRYDTMKDIVVGSGAFTAGDTDTVIVATGTNFPDALAATGLAGIEGAPVVLTAPDSLSTQAKETIQALSPSTIYIVGGTGAVSSAVENTLKTLVADPSKVIRSAGASRTATALDIYAKGGNAWGSTAIIACGSSFADALSISPYAYTEKAPVFLADSKVGLDADTITTLKAAIGAGAITHIVIVGGTGAVPDAVEVQLGYKTENTTIFTRLGGANRYATSALIAAHIESASASLGFHQIAVATGANFPDALAGGAFAGKVGTVLLLVDDSADGRSQIAAVVAAHKEAIGFGHVLGGEGAVSSALKAALESASSGS
jgi:putative cell wall-binding protein